VTELGNQPNPYRPLPPTDGTIRCAACHVPLLVPPAGATAGLCVGLSCIQPAVITSQRLRDFNLVMGMVLSGRMTAELEPETLVTWLTQVPLKPPRPSIVGYDDDGFIRYRDTGSPHGQTIRPGVDTLIGDDPRLDKYRDEAGDDGQQ
jgi:hypothetical protein